MTTLIDVLNQRSDAEKKVITDSIKYKIETCEILEPYLQAQGYCEEHISWILTRM